MQDWLDDTAPSAALARCKVCKDMMVLLLQLNGELPERFPGHDRRIYVFGCRRSTCRRREGSIRAIRGVRVWKEVEDTKREEAAAAEEERKKQEEEEAAEKAKAPGLGSTLFGSSSAFGGGAGANSNPFASGGGNPFSSGGGGSSANPFSTEAKKADTTEKPKAEEASKETLAKTFAETLSLNTKPASPPPPPEPWPTSSEGQPTPYPTLYLTDAEYETLDPTPSGSKGLPANARVESADAEEPSILDREAFESTMDAAFQKFADRLSQNPEQVIRYEFGGIPLLYSKTDDVAVRMAKGPAAGMPGCPNCGGRRAFEVQMTPHAIAELEEHDLSLEGMEWGTVIVGVCDSDCRPPGVGLGQSAYLEEWAGVQWEELVDRK